jgi:hypothetical protein
MHTEFCWGNFLANVYLEDQGAGLEDNIKVDLREMGCEERRLVELTQDHVQ